MNAFFHSEPRPARPRRDLAPRAALAAALGMAFALCTGPALAQAPSTPPELVDEAVIAIYNERGDGSEPVTLEQPARVRYELGAVVDARPEDGGLPRVMAVTPGRAAARMGLAAGDRLLAIGEDDLSAASDPGAALRDAVNQGHGVLRLTVDRAGRTVNVSGHLDRVDIPGYRLQIEPPAQAKGCGRLSTFLKPPVSQSLFPVILHEVDGRLPGPLDAEVFRLTPGRHVLKLSEAIDGTRFDGMENRRRARLMRNEMFKFLEIDVKPNTKYHLGVRFFPERKDPIRDQAYWEPVVWKETREDCGGGGTADAASGPQDGPTLSRAEPDTPPVPATAARERGCARLSTFQRPPRSTNIQPALLHTVDGRLAGSLDSEVVKVDAGQRLLRVGFQSALTRTPPKLRAGAVTRTHPGPVVGGRPQELQLDVEPGFRYNLGMKWVESPGEEGSGHWEPVVWKKTPESCS